MKIIVIGNKGYGVDCGCCHIGSNFEVHECTLKTLGQQLYDILSRHPFEDYYISIEHNTDTSARHSNKNDDIVRTTSNKEDVELENKESLS